MFKDNFITVCRAHHLALKSEKSYWCHASKYITWLGAKSAKDLEKDPTGNFRRYLSEMANENPNRINGNEGVSASTQNSTFHALRFLYEKVVGIPLGDLSNIPRAHGHVRIVDVPDDALARKIITAMSYPAKSVMQIVYETGRRTASVVRDVPFQGKITDLLVYRDISIARKRLRIKRKYTSLSIRYAGIRNIALKSGFLAAHKALDVKDANITEAVLGSKVLAILSS